LSTINMVFSNQDKILIKSLYVKRYKAKRLTDELPAGQNVVLISC